MHSDQQTPLRLAPTAQIEPEKYSVASRPTQYPKSNHPERVPLLVQLLQMMIVALLAVLAYWFVSHKLLQSVQVEGRSMAPTLQPSEHYFLNKWIYSLRNPERDDIVVLQDPQDSVWEVKRIIAKAGESVYIKKGAVYVNGERLKEPYLSPGTQTYAAEKADEFICCGKDQFYVLGDNRNVSRDSRYFGPIRRDNIVGKLIH